MPNSGSFTSVYLCTSLHIAGVVGARQFSLMSALSGAPNADYPLLLRAGSAFDGRCRIASSAQAGALLMGDRDERGNAA